MSKKVETKTKDYRNHLPFFVHLGPYWASTFSNLQRKQNTFCDSGHCWNRWPPFRQFQHRRALSLPSARVKTYTFASISRTVSSLYRRASSKIVILTLSWRSSTIGQISNSDSTLLRGGQNLWVHAKVSSTLQLIVVNSATVLTLQSANCDRICGNNPRFIQSTPIPVYLRLID